MDSIVIVTGGFDPIHSGHIDYIEAASKLGRVVVGLNSDAWLKRKKGIEFMPYDERYSVVSNLKRIMTTLAFDDSDNTACDAITQVKKLFPNNNITFANGGDRTLDNTPEMEKFKEDSQVRFVFEVGGGTKKNSSSWILQEWKAPKTERSWGYYRVLHEVEGVKVKELTVAPGKSLSMQQHQYRSEYWLVAEGKCLVHSRMPTGYVLPTIELTKHMTYKVPQEDWHQLVNPFDVPCRIVELQYGTECSETDIVRI